MGTTTSFADAEPTLPMVEKAIWVLVGFADIIYGRGKTMSHVRLTAELIAEEEGGYSVYCPELDIYTQGETEEECLHNLREAAELHLEELDALKPFAKSFTGR